MQDARFEDGGESALKLAALDAADLEVISALAQDAVFPASEISWNPAQRRFALLINRFRWEDKKAAEARGRPVERVQSVLSASDVLKVQSQGVQKGDKDMILSLLSLSFIPGDDGDGTDRAGSGGRWRDCARRRSTGRDPARRHPSLYRALETCARARPVRVIPPSPLEAMPRRS